jgi:hypothetical protein
MDERIVIRTNAKKRLCAHSRTYLCKQREVHGVMKHERRHGRRECGPVHNSEGLLLQQGQWLDVMPFERCLA